MLPRSLFGREVCYCYTKSAKNNGTSGETRTRISGFVAQCPRLWTTEELLENGSSDRTGCLHYPRYKCGTIIRHAGILLVKIGGTNGIRTRSATITLSNAAHTPWSPLC